MIELGSNQSNWYVPERVININIRIFLQIIRKMNRCNLQFGQKTEATKQSL